MVKATWNCPKRPGVQRRGQGGCEGIIVIPDTSAIVELIRGSEAGKAAEEILNGSELVLIPTLVLAELRSFLERNNLDASIVEVVTENGFVVPLEKDVAVNAGALHAKVKRKNKNVCPLPTA